MTRRPRRSPLLLVAITFCTLTATSLPAASDSWDTRDPRKLHALSKERAEAIDALITELNRLVGQTVPRKVTADDSSAWRAQTEWLKTIHSRMAGYHAKMTEKVFGRNLPNGKAMVEEMADLNREFLELQQATQKESRRFQTLSNASKARHDAAMNAIRNVR